MNYLIVIWNDTFKKLKESCFGTTSCVQFDGGSTKKVQKEFSQWGWTVVAYGEPSNGRLQPYLKEITNVVDTCCNKLLLLYHISNFSDGQKGRNFNQESELKHNGTIDIEICGFYSNQPEGLRELADGKSLVSACKSKCRFESYLKEVEECLCNVSIDDIVSKICVLKHRMAKLFRAVDLDIQLLVQKNFDKSCYGQIQAEGWPDRMDDAGRLVNGDESVTYWVELLKPRVGEDVFEKCSKYLDQLRLYVEDTEENVGKDVLGRLQSKEMGALKDLFCQQNSTRGNCFHEWCKKVLQEFDNLIDAARSGG